MEWEYFMTGVFNGLICGSTIWILLLLFVMGMRFERKLVSDRIAEKMLEQQKRTVEDIAKIYAVPPHYVRLTNRVKSLKRNLSMVSKELHQTRLTLAAYRDYCFYRAGRLRRRNVSHPCNKLDPVTFKGLTHLVYYEESVLTRRRWNPRNRRNKAS